MESKKTRSKKGYFTLLQLLNKAAGHKGLKLPKDASKALSKACKEYVLGKRRLAYLDECGIKREPRPDRVFTLVDKNPQAPIAEGWAHRQALEFQASERG